MELKQGVIPPCSKYWNKLYSCQIQSIANIKKNITYHFSFCFIHYNIKYFSLMQIYRCLIPWIHWIRHYCQKSSQPFFLVCNAYHERKQMIQQKACYKTFESIDTSQNIPKMDIQKSDVTGFDTELS